MAYKTIRLFQEDPWVTGLYERAFPANERRDLKNLMQPGQDVGAIVLVCRDGEKVGFYCTLRCLGICHIIYFAVPEALRDQGIGSGILQQVVRDHPGERVIVDIEAAEAGAANNGQRAARKAFYLRNGFEKTEIEYRWEGEAYEILSHGGNVTKAEWHAFWDFIQEHDRKLLY